VPEQNVINSKPYDGPFVRVRGRLSRQDVVTWSPCLRTHHPPSWPRAARVEAEGPAGAVPYPGDQPVSAPGQAASAQPALSGDLQPDGSTVSHDGHEYFVVFEDAQGKQVARAPVRIRFFDADRALFTQRLPYHRDTRRVVLLRGEHELGALLVPPHTPEFVLTHPRNRDEVDVYGVLHLRWKLAKSEEARARKAPLTYYVRYSADGGQWYRPGVNITETSFDLDLREMPGGDRCVSQVIATNGYQTSYVETPPFSVPPKPPEILLATPEGPLLFAQGFSREDGPLVGEAIEWLTDGKNPVGTGASFDVRHLGGRIRTLAVRVTDRRGVFTIQHLGLFNGETGVRVTSDAGI
jgi:hypothetical protein